MKRLGQIVLSLGLLLVFLVLSPMPEAQAATNIPSVSVTLTVPVAGARPDYNPGLPSGAPTYYSDNYNSENYANDMAWRDLTSGDIYLPVATGTFEVGHKYRVNIFLTPVDGYAFTSSTTATVNGASASASPFNSNQLEVKYTFPALPFPKPVINHPARLRFRSGGPDGHLHRGSDGRGNLSVVLPEARRKHLEQSHRQRHIRYLFPHHRGPA